MQLPGGIVADGERHRDFCFRPVTGALELALSESIYGARNHSERVTAVLAQALQSLCGEEPASVAQVRTLSVGDRQFLMRRLACHVDDRPLWLTAQCRSCGERFDVSVRQSELPVKPAGSDYPELTVETRQGALCVRVPTGADQEAIAGFGEEEACRALLERLASPAAGAESVDLACLNEEEIAAIESRVEAMAPEVASRLLAECPDCGEANQVAISPYVGLERPAWDLFTEVHRLAAAYHWGEREILEMPRARRQIYLRLIDRSRGMHGREASLEGG